MYIYFYIYIYVRLCIYIYTYIFKHIYIYKTLYIYIKKLSSKGIVHLILQPKALAIQCKSINSGWCRAKTSFSLKGWTLIAFPSSMISFMVFRALSSSSLRFCLDLAYPNSPRFRADHFFQSRTELMQCQKHILGQTVQNIYIYT